jgi:o-succinylbenzoate synthase
VRLTLWRDDAVLARPVEAARERHLTRPRLYLELEHDGVTGYGEVGVQPAALNGDPSVDEVAAELAHVLLAQVVVIAEREGVAPDWTRAVRWRSPRPASRVGVALVEMALLDRALRAASSTLAELWPARFATASLATVSLLDDGAWPEGDGVARLRVKTRPGPLSRTAMERLAATRCEVLLDFNASAAHPLDVISQATRVSSVARLAGVEQPFAPGNLVDHAALAARLEVALSIDEGLRTAGDLDQIARYRAASMVCVKPARVGGLATARTLAARAADHGIAAYLGGFFESDFARGVARTLAAHAFSQPSDLGAVARSDLGAPESRDVPDGLGVAPSAAVLAHARRVVTLG